MKAYITSIGEPTTDLCKWSLERNDFEVVMCEGSSTLASKLRFIYGNAKDDFVRVDADVIPNRNLNHYMLDELDEPEVWWHQFLTFDWYRQNTGYGGVQFVKKEAIPFLRDNIKQHIDAERPETAMSRLQEFYDPRRFRSEELVMGLHNFKNDMKRVAATKERRGQSANYDFELARRIEEL